MSSTKNSIDDLGMQLYQAASSGRTELIERKARFRFYGNSKFGELQETALHAAIRSGHLAAAKRLLELGVRTDIVNSAGNLPLHLSAYRCEPELINLFCKSVITPKIINTLNKEGHTPLFCALNNADDDVYCSRECIEALLACGADVNTPGKCGQLPIERAMKVEENACVFFELLAPKTKSRDIVKHALDLLVEGASGYDELDDINYADIIRTALSVFPNVWDMYAEVEEKKKCKCTLSKAEHEASSFLDTVFAATEVAVNSSVLSTVAEFGSDAAFLYQLENMDDQDLPEKDVEDYTDMQAMENPNIRDSSICIFLQRMTAKFSIKEFAASDSLYNAVNNKRHEVVDHLIHSFPALLRKPYFEEMLLFKYITLGTSTTILKKMFDASNKDFSYKWLEEETLVELCLKNVTELQVPFLSECVQFDRERVIKSLVVPFMDPGFICEKTESELHTAVKKGRLELCEFFIFIKPALANMADYKGMLPLSYAIEGQSNEMVLMLLKHTPDPNGFASSAVLDICSAVNNGRLSQETIKQLLSKGLRCCDGVSAGKYPNKDNPWLGKWCTGYRLEDEQPSVVLHEAAAAGNNTELQRLATEGGTDWYLVDSLHRTVLHVAIENYDISFESIRMLVENGALVNRVGGPAMNTPLHLALDEDRMDVCEYLLTWGAEPCIADKNCDSAIHQAIHYGMWETVRMMLPTTKDLCKCNAKGSSLLTEIIRDSCAPFDVLENLVALGGDVNSHSSQYNRNDPKDDDMANVDTWPGLLHIAVRIKNMKLVKLLCNEKVPNHAEFSSIHVLVSIQDTEFAKEVIASLLRNGEDINESDMLMNKTPLEVAAELGSVSMLQFLIAHGAKLDIHQQTTLGKIVLENRCCPEILLSLIQAGIDINAECKKCIGPYDFCPCSREIGFHAVFICSLLRNYAPKIYGHKVVCKLAIHFSLAIKDVRLESEEFQAAVGASIHSALLALNQGPQSLAVQCRDFIRRQCRPRDGCVPYRSLGAALDTIPVPHIIKSFLKMEDVDLDDIRAALTKEGEEEVMEPCDRYLSTYTTFMFPLHQNEYH